jgi:thiol-disulfide isomerase/thioredoxin
LIIIPHFFLRAALHCFKARSNLASRNTPVFNFLPGSGERMNRPFFPAFAFPAFSLHICRRSLMAASMAGVILMHSPSTVAAARLETQAPKAMPAVHDARLRALLAQNKNTPLILIFWASWCEPCREEMPALQRLSERWRNRGLQIITIAVADRPEAANDFLAKTAARLPLVLDPEQNIAKDWGIYMLPSSLVLDRRHRIVGRAHGAIDWDAVAVDPQLQSLFQRK